MSPRTNYHSCSAGTGTGLKSRGTSLEMFVPCRLMAPRIVLRSTSRQSSFFVNYMRGYLISCLSRIYTLDMSAISVLVEEARDLYKETSRPNVVVYSADIVRLSTFILPFKII